MILECVYNSADRNITTFVSKTSIYSIMCCHSSQGGERSRDEMCFAFLFYYPAMNLSTCLSLTHPSAYDEWLDAYVP